MTQALFTDFYQLTMAYGYWKNNIHNKRATFNMFFRTAPFKGQYAIFAGLETFINYINAFKYDQSDLDYFRSLKLFNEEFLQYLQTLKLSLSIDAVREGTLVFPQEPLIKVTGSLLECQIIETALLNIINFQTLIATKAHILCSKINNNQSIIEFGLRRAQGFDGGLSASRASYIGGCSGTSNVMAGKIFNIPVKGTHAHSWVMSFDSEKEAFTKYYEVFPSRPTFLVDTYDTLNGVETVLQIAKEKNIDSFGMRIDSGNIDELATKIEALIENYKFNRSKITLMASNDIDEDSKILNSPAINIFGIGTNLVTGGTQSALGGVYKLSKLEDINKIKVSEDLQKSTLPGNLCFNRIISGNHWINDIIYNSDDNKNVKGTPMLEPIFIDGKQTYMCPTLEQIKDRVKKEWGFFKNYVKFNITSFIKLDELLTLNKTMMVYEIMKTSAVEKYNIQKGKKQNESISVG